MSCIVSHWPDSFRKLYGGVWPRNYCCFDLESTGFGMTYDVVTELGHVLVQDGKITDRLSIILDWTKHKVVPLYWLEKRLATLKQAMLLKGRKSHITIERMRAEGMEPEKALAFYHKFMTTLLDREVTMVAHGGYTFDEKMFAANLKGFGVAETFSFGDNSLLDTDGIEKASQCLHLPKMYPEPNDTLRSYFHRVKYARVPGIKSTLDEHCFNKYGFGEKYGLKKKDMHGTDPDSYCCHLLMEEWRGMIKPYTPPALAQVVTKTVNSKPPTIVATGVRRRGQRNN